MATKKPETEAAETKAKAKEQEYWITIPYAEGEPQEETVGINGKNYQIRKGVSVCVPKAVFKILIRKNRQIMVAYENQQKMKNQRQDW